MARLLTASLLPGMFVGAVWACADPAPKISPRPPDETPTSAVEDPAPSSPKPGTAKLRDCGDGRACYRAALAAYRSGGPEGASALYAAACGRQHARACHQLGVLYRDGLGVQADDERARAFFEQACGLGSTEGCDAMGH